MIVARVVTALCAVLLAGAADGALVSPAVRARAAADGSVAVVVALRDAGRAAGARAAMLRRRDALLARLEPGALTVEHAYVTVPGFAGRVTAQGLARLAADPDVLQIDLDTLGTVAIDDGVAHVRADRVHRRGVSGAGTTIAVIDTGVEADHPDIIDALVHEECFCSAGVVDGVRRPDCCPDGSARASGPGSAASVDAHGPHVAGIAVSRGRVAPPGMAPGALLVAVRVLDEDNFGFVSDWIAALDWILAERPDVRIVNMSLVSTAVYNGDCGRNCGGQNGCAANMMLADVIGQLRQRGTLVFAASGNDARARAMTSPACVSQAVAVGAVDAADVVPRFSNASGEIDLLAPGVDILSDDLGGEQGVMSGTSMASPHAAGAAALIMAARPGLTADAVEELLLGSGQVLTDRRTGRRTPRLDAFAALRQAMRGAELERGSGSRATDCLLEWNVVPPSIVRRYGWPLAECRDNDPSCDADGELGRCTFVYSPCFNMHDPLLRQCAVDEPLHSFTVASPPIDAPAGSLDRINVDYFASALPDFPFAGADTCSAPVPFIVARRAGGDGVGHLRVGVASETRRDYDHIIFRCLRP